MIKLLVDRKVTNVMKKEIKKIKLTDNISYYISDNTIYLFQDEYNFSKDDIKIIGKKVALLIQDNDISYINITAKGIEDKKSLYHDLGFTLSYYDVNKLNELFSDKKDKIKYRCYGIMTKSDFLNRLMEDKKVEEKKEKEARAAKENAAVDKAIENAEMDIPDAMLNTQVRQMLDDFSRRMQSQGLSMDQYFQFTGMTAEKIGEQMKPQAIKRIQTRLVLEAVVKAENIQADDAAVEEQFDKMAEDFKMDKEQIKGMFGEEQMAQLKEDLAVQKAIDFLVAEAKFVD